MLDPYNLRKFLETSLFDVDILPLACTVEINKNIKEVEYEN